MAWQNPKTDWKAGDVPTASDFNRIEGNVQELQNTKETPAGAQAKASAAAGMVASELTAHKADEAAHNNKLIPSGLIAMWSGLITNIPTGWALCDGTNGTPNLKDRFIMGATTDETINKTGGQNSVTLTTAHLPAHAHSGSTSTSGAHVHQLQSCTDYDKDNTQYGINRIVRRESFEIRTSEPVSSAGSHSHSFTTTNVGGDQPHENRPAYYTLAFIMKL